MIAQLINVYSKPVKSTINNDFAFVVFLYISISCNVISVLYSNLNNKGF